MAEADVIAAALAGVVAAALIALYLALGGATYKPFEVADPCRARSLAELQEREDVLERLALSALDGAACRLRVTREELTVALATPAARAEFARTHHIGDAQIENAVRAGLARAIEDAERTRAVSAFEALLLREGLERLPVDRALEFLRSARGRSVLERLEELLRGRFGGG